MNTETITQTEALAPTRWGRKKKPSFVAKILPWVIGLICIVADVIALITIASRSQ